MTALVDIKNLSVTFDTYAGKVLAVRNMSLSIQPGEIVAIVGESGCGKTVLAQALMGLLPPKGCDVTAGHMLYDSQELRELSPKELRRVRGEEMGIVFQDPMTSLNPTIKIGRQIGEGIRIHKGLSRSAAHALAVQALEQVGIPNPEMCARQYPHQLSGGMRQRVMIALAMMGSPKLLIADEPTTALDVTTQAQILDLLRDLQKQTNSAILLITHDLSIIPDLCQKVVVMYAGKIVEKGTAEQVLRSPQHPYTRALLNAVPKMDKKTPLQAIQGSPPDLRAPPSGCAFWPRCPNAVQLCQREEPQLLQLGETHLAACWRHHSDVQRYLGTGESK